MRSVARRFGVSLCTVQRWVARGKGKRLDRADLADRPGGCPVGPRRTPAQLEELVLATRADLRANSDLGEYGAAAVHARLAELQTEGLPSVRTINRIFERLGALDCARRPAPPPGWYLADLAARRVELDSSDIIEGLVIGKTADAAAANVELLNAITLFGSLVDSWPTTVVTAKYAVDRAVARWRSVGLPRYAQFDNDTIFQGPHQWPDTFGRVTRACLSLGSVPVFAPPHETGFHAAIESYNGRWQAKVWTRFEHPTPAALVGRSDRYIAAARLLAAARIESAPPRRPFPAGWSMAAAPRKPLAGRVVFLPPSDAACQVTVLGPQYAVDAAWPGRLVRADVDLDAKEIRFHAPRRRQHNSHRLLCTTPYTPPKKQFRE